MIGDRIKEVMEEKGLNGADLAKACGVAPSSVTKWLRNDVKRIKGEYLIKLAKILDVNISWLQTGNGFKKGKSVIAIDEDTELPDSEYVTIPESQVVFSAGPGYEPSLEEITEGGSKAVYKRSWFQMKQVNPEHCARFRVRGNSMAKLINDGDMILVNTHEKEIQDNRVYCISISGETKVKRLLKTIKGSLLIKSDNPEYPTEELSAEEANEKVRIIGRVIDRSGDGLL